MSLKVRKATESDNLILTRSAALMIREIETDEDAGYADFYVRLCSDFRRPLYHMWGGGVCYERLIHTEEALDTDFIDRGMSFVQARSHYSGDRPGKIRENSIELKREGDLVFAYGVCRIIDDGQAGTAMIRRWRAETDRNLSIDYMWRAWTEEHTDDSDDVDIVVDDWQLRGVSAVGNPADEHAGVVSEREITILSEVLKMKPKGDGRSNQPDATQTDPPADDKSKTAATRDGDPKPSDDGGDANNRTDTNANRANAPKTGDDPAGDKPAKRSYDDMLAEMKRDFDTAIEAVSKDKPLDESLRSKLEDEVMGEAKGRLRHGEDYVSGTAGSAVFQFLAINREQGLKVNEEFKIEGGEIRRDHTQNRMVRTVADTANHIYKSRGPGFNLSEGALDVALNKPNSRNAGAHMEYHHEVLNSMGEGIRETMLSAGGAIVPPEMYLRMLLNNERRCSAERKKQLTEVLERAFSVTGDTGGKGGNLVDTDVLIEEFVPALYASAHSDALGVRTFMGVTSNLKIPQQTSKLTEAWLTESGEYTLSDATIGAVITAPHRIAAGSDITHLLDIQTGGRADMIIEGIIYKDLDEAIDVAFLRGSASGLDPTGVINTSGIQTGNVSFAAAGAGARFKAVLAIVNLLREADVPGPYTWSLAAEAIATLQASPRDTSGGSGGYIMEGNQLVDITAHSTTILSGDTANDKFGVISDWGNSIIVVYGMPFLIEDPYTRKNFGERSILVQCFMDHIITQAVRFATANASAV